MFEVERVDPLGAGAHAYERVCQVVAFDEDAHYSAAYDDRVSSLEEFELFLPLIETGIHALSRLLRRLRIVRAETRAHKNSFGVEQSELSIPLNAARVKRRIKDIQLLGRFAVQLHIPHVLKQLFVYHFCTGFFVQFLAFIFSDSEAPTVTYCIKH